MVICEICKKEFKRITKTHLNKHNLDFFSYKKLFPDSKLFDGPVSLEIRKKISNKLLGTKLSEETKNKISNSLNKIISEGKWTPYLKRGNSLIDDNNRDKWKKSLEIYYEKKKKNTFLDIEQTCLNDDLELLKKEDNFITTKCLKCGTVFKFHKQLLRNSKRKNNICYNCFPRDIVVSQMEIELRDYIKNIYSGEVIFNDRKELFGKEIDIFIPEKRIGIEISGLYWHSENQHIDKFNIYNKYCMALKNNVRIINIFEDEWIYKREIVKNRLKHILNLNKEHLHARKCEIKNIDNNSKNIFLNSYHIQGTDKSSIKLGAFFENELIAVMTFRKSSFIKGSKTDDIELNRYAMKKEISSNGLASKMFKYFIKNYKFNNIISYSDKRWNSGKLYKKLGFIYSHSSKPNYWYIVDGKRLHRSNFMKHKLKKYEDMGTTEKEIMKKLHINRIYDAGNSKWIFEKINQLP